MPNIPTSEQECQQDALERLNNWLNTLEGRVCGLLNGNNPESMRPVEREQAANRHLLVILRMLQDRQHYAQANPSSSEQAFLDALFGGPEEE